MFLNFGFFFLESQLIQTGRKALWHDTQMHLEQVDLVNLLENRHIHFFCRQIYGVFTLDTSSIKGIAYKLPAHIQCALSCVDEVCFFLNFSERHQGQILRSSTPFLFVLLPNSLFTTMWPIFLGSCQFFTNLQRHFSTMCCSKGQIQGMNLHTTFGWIPFLETIGMFGVGLGKCSDVLQWPHSQPNTQGFVFTNKKQKTKKKKRQHWTILGSKKHWPEILKPQEKTRYRCHRAKTDKFCTCTIPFVIWSWSIILTRNALPLNTGLHLDKSHSNSFVHSKCIFMQVGPKSVL